MTKSIRFKPCCSKYKELTNQYLDLSIDAEQALRMIAALLLSAKSLDLLSIETITELGHTLENYLDKQVIQQHFFFSRSLSDCSLGDGDRAAEMYRIKLSLKNSIGD